MAEKYDFDYELVTYSWPHWLRAQTEKQRIIWAYKILFLDVLFPLDLDKVIFVDADQVMSSLNLRFTVVVYDTLLLLTIPSFFFYIILCALDRSHGHEGIGGP